MLDPTEIVNKIILTPTYDLYTFHAKATDIKNTLSTVNFSYPPHKLLQRHLQQLSQSPKFKQLILVNCINLKKYLKKFGDIPSKPNCSKDLSDILICLQLCDLISPLVTNSHSKILCEPSIRAATDVETKNKQDLQDENLGDATAAVTESDRHSDVPSESSPELKATDLKKRLDKICFTCGQRVHDKNTCRARGSSF